MGVQVMKKKWKQYLASILSVLMILESIPISGTLNLVSFAETKSSLGTPSNILMSDATGTGTECLEATASDAEEDEIFEEELKNDLREEEDLEVNVATVSDATVSNAYELMLLTDDGNRIWNGTIDDGFAYGEGTEEDPYVILTPEELAYFAESISKKNTYENKYISLEEDIYLNDVSDFEEWSLENAPDNVWNGYSGFNGTFDGNGHTIYGLFMNRSERYTGFFNSLENKTNVVFRNLSFRNAYVSGTSKVGVLAGISDGAVIENCFVDGIVIGSSSDVGGLIGDYSSSGADGLKIVDCINEASILGTSNVGGLVGSAYVGNGMGYSPGGDGIIEISNCINRGTVKGTKDYVGGVAGRVSRTLNCDGFVISELGNEGDVSGTSSVGGVIGFLQADYEVSELNSCYNEGNIRGTGSYTGGVIGQTSGYPKLRNIYNVGKINGYKCVGGLAGQISSNTLVIYAHQMGKVNGSSFVCSLIGKAGWNYYGAEGTIKNAYYLTGTAQEATSTSGKRINIVELTESEFGAEGYFDKLDFDTIWLMGDEYPVFQWQFGNDEPEEENRNDQYIIERVKEYTSDELYAQYMDIFESEDSEETKFQRYTELFEHYGILDYREGISYVSNINSERWAYLNLITDESYCAYNYFDWLNNSVMARSVLTLNALIFNYEFSDWIDISTYMTGDYPGVSKYKDMLYEYIDKVSFKIETLDYTNQVRVLTENVSDGAKLYAEALINELNNCTTRAERSELMKKSSALQIYQDIKVEGDDIGSIKLKFRIDENSGFGKYMKGLDYTRYVLAGVDHVIDFIELDSRLKAYETYKAFLDEIAISSDLPLEMRLAALQITEEMDADWWKEVYDIAMNVIEESKVLGCVNDTVFEKVLGELGTQTFKDYLALIKIEAYFVNKIIDVESLVKGIAYIEGYTYLGRHYKNKLIESKEMFLLDPSAENAWDFYENYNMLWHLRTAGEEAYLKASKIGGVVGLFADFGYTMKEDVVNDTLKILDERCRFMIEEGIEIPESVKYASKIVIDCPVDVAIYSPEGELITILRDGQESDITNEHGRFAVIHRSYTGEYAKVICLNSEGNYGFEVIGVGSGLVDLEMAMNQSESVELYSFNNLEIKENSIIDLSIEQIMDSQSYEIDQDGDGMFEAIGKLEVYDENMYVPLETLELDINELILEAGENYVFHVNIMPDDVTNKNLYWISSAEDVVQISSAGVVKVLKHGSATIYCVSQDNVDMVGKCQITVKDGGSGYQHIHNWDIAWENDENNHWHNCLSENCNITKLNEMNGFSSHVYDMESEICSICGFNRASNLRHSLTVDGGTGTGIYQVGDEIVITCENAELNHFVEWKLISGNATIMSPSDPETKVVMGNSDVMIKAIYLQSGNLDADIPEIDNNAGSSTSGNSSSGGSSSGGGGGGSTAKTGTVIGNASLPFYVVRGIWTQTETGDWRFTDTSGTVYKNTWAAVYNPYADIALGHSNFDWFYFDVNGHMATGWIEDNGKKYYLNPESDGTKGRMITGWQQIDNKWYYFNEVSDGTKGARLSDAWIGNYYVNTEGVWEASR